MTETNQTSVTLEWDKSYGASYYYILFESNSNDAQHVISNTTSVQMSLPHNEEYSVYIWAANCIGNSSDPSIVTVTTGMVESLLHAISVATNTVVINDF